MHLVNWLVVIYLQNVSNMLPIAQLCEKISERRNPAIQGWYYGYWINFYLKFNVYEYLLQLEACYR